MLHDKTMRTVEDHPEKRRLPSDARRQAAFRAFRFPIISVDCHPLFPVFIHEPQWVCISGSRGSRNKQRSR